MSMEDYNKLFYRAQTIVQEKNDQGQLEELIQKGLDVNRKDEYGISLVERASFGSVNYNALFSLWTAKATPTSEYVREVFEEFNKGKTSADLYKESEEILKLKNAPDFSRNFSAKKLKVENASFEITEEINDNEDSELILTIELKPYLYEGRVIETKMEFIAPTYNEMKKNLFTEDGHSFTGENVSSSIYIQDVHNPVDLKRLKISKGKKYYNLVADLHYDFEYENTTYANEVATLKFKVPI